MKALNHNKSVISHSMMNTTPRTFLKADIIFVSWQLANITFGSNQNHSISKNYKHTFGPESDAESMSFADSAGVCWLLVESFKQTRKWIYIHGKYLWKQINNLI